LSIRRLQTATERCPDSPRLLLPNPRLTWSALAAAALLSLALAGALYLGLGTQRTATPPPARSGVSRATDLTSLPLTAQGPISAALGAASPAYRVGAVPGGFQLRNPEQHLRARFGRAGVGVRDGALEAGLSLRAVGFGGSLAAVGESAPSAAGNRVLYARGGLSEWYVNGPLGLEQGFTLARAPTGREAGPLTLAIALTGNAHAALASRGRGITLSRAGGPSLRYGALAAMDAQGRALHSWLELAAGRLLLRVEADGARYPIRIDPLVEQAKLQAEEGKVYFGHSVALSADGNTALVGGPSGDEGVGAAWVFTREGSSWSAQQKLEGSKEAEDDRFGRSVALSADGNTAVVGDPGSREDTGAAWVYTREGSTWTKPTKLEGGGEIGSGKFGRDVALSADGHTALIGGFANNGEVGAAWVFSGSGSSWTQEAKLEGGGEEANGKFGRSVALSANGGTALIGGLADGEGAAWVFTGSGSTWTQQAKLKGGDGGPEDSRFGGSVALSGDGNTALIGSVQDNNRAGAAWVFGRAGEEWSEDQMLSGGAEESGEGGFGSSVALSADGGSALIGGQADNGDLGAAWLFTRSASEEWTQQRPKLTGGGEVGEGSFGWSVALSGDASTAFVSGFTNEEGAGAAWVFASRAPSVASVEPDEGPGAGGTRVTITGARFTNPATVDFGGTEAENVDVESPTQISATSPPGTGTVDVTVTTAEGKSATGPDDRFSYGPAVTKVSPATGPSVGGTPVTITGSGFTSSAIVEFGAVKATGVKVQSPTKITAISPPGGGSVDVTVTTAEGKSAAVAADVFKYVPSVTKVKPAEGPAAGATEVTVTGTGFTSPATVSFGSVEAEEVEVKSPTTITAISPPGVGSVEVNVTTAGGTSAAVAADRFKYLPSVTKVQPGEGPAAGGTEVTITGTGFTSPATVSFGSTVAEHVTVESPTQISTISPPGTGVVDVTVTTAGGRSATGSPDHFSYVSPPLLVLLSGLGGGGGPGVGVLPSITVQPPPTVPPPVLGVQGNVAPVSGKVYVREPGSSKWVLLSSLREVPFGTVINALHGVVTVTTIGPHGRLQTGQFYGGVFVLTQGRNGRVVATLVGGNFGVCPTAGERSHLASISSKRASGKHVVRKLWANAHGSFSTKGNYAAGAVQGTKWLTEDLCDGTLIMVARDKVKVTNLVTHKTIEVFTRHSYLAKAP